MVRPPSTLTPECVCVYVCACVSVEADPTPPFTAHRLNMLLGQPHQLVCYATYQTDTCRRNYGMSTAGALILT